MRRRGLLSRLAVLFIVAVLVAGNSVIPTEAGASTIIVDNTSFAEEVNNSVWSNPDGNVKVENSILVFPKTSTSETRLITKTAARASEKNEELVNINTTIRLETLPSGQKFILALGLSSIEAVAGSTGNVEIQFTNNGGVKASVVAYGNEGEQQLISATSLGRLNQYINIQVSVKKDGQLTFMTGNRVLGKAKLPVSGEGRVGFLQTGNCAAKVKDLKVVSYRYDSPENCDISEDFESGSMNVNLLTSMMTIRPSVYRPCYAAIQEYEGNQVFMCNNSGETYIGTLYQYSNFEISFDVPYLRTVAEWNKEGQAVKPVCGEFLVGWGYSSANPTGAAEYMTAEQSVSFLPGSQIIPRGYEDQTVVPENYPFFNQGEERGVSIKLSVVDTEVVVYMKWIEETAWTEVLRYHTGTMTSLGYIQLWMLTPGNIAIDNLKIVNKDAEPKLVTVDTKYDYLDKAEDYQYVKEENVYKDLAVKEETFNWYRLIPIVAGVCVATFGTTWGITAIIRRKKGGSNDEK